MENIDESLPVATAVVVATNVVPVSANTFNNHTTPSEQPLLCVRPSVQVFLGCKLFTKAPTTLILEDKFPFSVKDVKGKTWFECKGKPSFGSKKVINDAEGNLVFMSKKKNWEEEWCIFRQDRRRPIFKVKSQSWKQLNLRVIVPNIVTGQEMELFVKFEATSASDAELHGTVYIGEPKNRGVAIARIYRDNRRQYSSSGSRLYFVDITEGIDAAMIVALSFCFNDLCRWRCE